MVKPVVWAAIAMVGTVLAAPPDAGAVEMLAHRAAYVMSLASARNNGGVVAARGAMYYQFADSCDGWTTEQRYRLRLAYAQGPDVELISTMTSWESKEGLRYRFRVRNQRDGEVTEDIQGEAELPQAGQAGTAIFTQPKLRQDLPAGTIFPTQHTRQLLETATTGGNRLFKVLFDGASLDGPFEVNAVIGAVNKSSKDAAKTPVKAEFQPFLANPAWWVRLAFFPVGGKQPLPAYELGLRYHANGVAESMKLDYGDFVIDTLLDKIEAVPAPNC